MEISGENANMAIWLGKQYLGQKDSPEESICGWVERSASASPFPSTLLCLVSIMFSVYSLGFIVCIRLVYQWYMSGITRAASVY